MSLAIRIHRGTHQVGGTCIELRAPTGERLVLDAGMPMTMPRRGRDLLPDVPGLWAPGDGSLQGVVISHPHPDHHGLVDLVDRDVPILLGERAQAILAESAFFIPWGPSFTATAPIAHRTPTTLGPFTITPFRVDHSAEDAYALLVEAGGRRVLYTGDWRGHGSHPETVDELTTNVGPLDALLCEGTRVDRDPVGETDALPTESAVEDAFVELMDEAPGAVLAFASGQNLDRLDRIRAACCRSGRTMVMDLYGAAIWEAARREPLREARGTIRVYLPHWQRRRIIESQAFERLDALREQRIYADELRDRASELALVVRTSALSELENTGVLLDADAAWSMWPGYLREESMQPSLRILRRNGVPLHHIHTSGHATADDLRAFAHRLDAHQVVPIHTSSPQVCAWSFPRVTLRQDGEWWEA